MTSSHALKRLLDSYENAPSRSPLRTTRARAGPVLNFEFAVEEIHQIKAKIEGASANAGHMVHSRKIDLQMVRQTRVGKREGGTHVRLTAAVQQIAREKKGTPVIRCSGRCA